MQGLQKAKCASCGVMFMSDGNSTKCPSCAASHGGDHSHGMGGCGCGHSH